MVVNQEIKSQLAKLLATEDLVVEHKRVDTAQFNVHTRVLILPRWERASNSVYDMLVGHEVGHALFTPDRDWLKEIQIPQQFVNVVEDARIEKLMKRKYPGLAKTFYRGYNELHNNDFFETYGEDLNTFNLADRANLYFKVGNFLPVVFSSTEKQIISLINRCETFDDTLEAAVVLYKHCKTELDKSGEESEEQNGGVQGQMNFGGEKDAEEMTDDELLEELERGLDDQKKTSEDPAQLDTPSYKQGGDDNEPDIKTAESLEDAIKRLAETLQGRESVYFEIPKLNVDNHIISNKAIYDNCRTYWENAEADWEKMNMPVSFGFEEVDDEFVKFKRSAQKEVSYLVKEFECKKSADSYARATTARTGVLNCSKLHTYKYNEDLFRKVTTFADGKNHGLVFVLDWSGSMANVMLDTIKQLYNLMWFCKKVNIPFEVYAFTNDYPMNYEGYRKPSYEKKEGLALVQDTFSLMNLFTSKVNSKTLDEQMKFIFRIASSLSHYSNLSIPLGMRLSGTPLNESIIALHEILPRFKKENKVQKVQCVILSDGESCPLRYSREIQRRVDSEPFMGSAYIGQHCVMRDRKTGHTYSFIDAGHWADVTDSLLENLGHNFPDVNLIGIRVLTSRDAGQFVRRYTGYADDMYDKIMKRWKKEKSFAIKTSGYDTYFGLSSNALLNDDEFEVEESATKVQIKRAFVKSLKSKKMNKKVLGEFIELIA